MVDFKNHQPDPRLDLVLERVVDVPSRLVWAAWTRPEHLKHWFTPAPWKTVDCGIDLRPGGCFDTVMRSPEGRDFPNTGCYLEVVENERLVWTDALQAGYRPSERGHLTDSMGYITALLRFEPSGEGTNYRAVVLHRSEEDRKKHEAMGFHEGWGKALDQMVEYIKGADLR